MSLSRLGAAALAGALLLLWDGAARAQVQAAEPVVEPAVEVIAAGEDAFNRLTVPVKINGQGPFPFIVDTGANRTVVSADLAQMLKLPSGPQVRVHGVVAGDLVETVRVKRLDVGSRHLSNVVAPVLARRNIGGAGLIGVDALRNQKIVLDFRAKVMTVEPSAPEPRQAGQIVVKGRSHLGQLVFLDAQAHGIPLYVVLDTGGEVTIGNLVLREMLHRQSDDQPVSVRSITGDRATLDVTTVPKVTFGKAVVFNMPVAYADLYAFKQFGLADKPSILLGMDVLRQFERVSIDFKRHEVRFLLPQQAD